MDVPILTRHLLRTPPSCRCALTSLPRQTRTFALYAPQTRFLSTPTILRPSFWATMIPKALKTRSSAPRPHSREWNPATPFIVLALLVGSQAIQVLWLKQERAHAARKAEAKIGLLREVIERVQNGEDVEVEKVLGTGDESAEREWHEVLKEVREEEALFQSKKKRRALREEAAKQSGQQGSVVGQVADERLAKVESIGGVRFY